MDYNFQHGKLYTRHLAVLELLKHHITDKKIDLKVLKEKFEQITFDWKIYKSIFGNLMLSALNQAQQG